MNRIVLVLAVLAGSGILHDACRAESPKAADAPAPAGAVDAATVDRWAGKFRGWHYWPDHVIPASPAIEGFSGILGTDVPTVYQVPGDAKWYMTFVGFDGKGYQSFVAESADLLRWKPRGLAMGYGPPGEFDHGGCVVGAYLYESYDLKAPRLLKKHQGKYWTLYGAYPLQGGYELRPGYEGVASSDDGLTWKRAKPGYILSVHERDRGQWEKDCIYQPWLVEHEGRFYNFYNAANGSVEQIGLATSTDLLNWTRHPGNPVLRNRPGGYDEQFCSDGKVFRDGDHWVMFYFGVGRGGAHVMAAFSRDLVHWTAHPEPLYKAGGNPSGLDKQYAHKISLVHNPANDTFYLFYNAVPGKPGGTGGRGIGLITSKPLDAAPAAGGADKATYLADVSALLAKPWPGNRTVTIVCHGHSVPAGYFRTPAVDTFNAYPHLLHKGLKDAFGLAVINVIVTAIGGENSESGAARFERDVLSLRPDVVTIDYALNDRGLGLERARKAWVAMIEKAKAAGVRVILLTPTADSSARMDDPADPLNQHARQVRLLAAEHRVGLVDSTEAFSKYVRGGGKLEDLMSQVNHPNRKGHDLVAAGLLEWFPRAPN